MLSILTATGIGVYWIVLIWSAWLHAPHLPELNIQGEQQPLLGSKLHVSEVYAQDVVKGDWLRTKDRS